MPDKRLQWGRGLSTAEMHSKRGGETIMKRVLQWGRGLSTAEIRILASELPRNRPLQWGRGLSTAEISLRPGGSTGTTSLQWGRGLSTAEIRRRGSWPARLTRSFNGAAVSQPRKCVGDVGGGCLRGVRFNGAAVSQPRKSQSPPEMSTLSWCFNGAAVSQPRKSPHGMVQVRKGHSASMGPRSLNRGNAQVESLIRELDTALQWGRGLSTAEM